VRRKIEQQFPFAFAAPPPVDFLGIGFFETTEKTCMYPEGMGQNMLFCGQPRADGSSYCPGHFQICYWRPDSQNRRAA
jgi:hypothetical protein